MSKMRSKPGRAAPHRSFVPDDECPTCGALMKEARGRLKLSINGEEVPVPSVPHLECPSCGEVVLRLHEAKRLHEDAVELYRRKHGLLTAGKIRALR